MPNIKIYKIRFLILHFVIFIFFSSNKLYAQNIYQINNIIANAQEQSPTLSRQNAIYDARRRAFSLVLQQLEFQIDANELFSNKEIEQIIRSQQINNERFADNEYWASLNIIFDKDFLDQYIIEKDLKLYKINLNSEPYILLPIQNKDGKISLWNNDNIWYQTMLKNKYNTDNTKFIVPEFSIENLSIVDEDKLHNIVYLNKDHQHLAKLSEKYNVKSFYILLYNYNNLDNKAIIDIFYIKDNYKKQTRLSFVNTEALSQEALLNIIAKKTVIFLANQSNNNITSLNKNIYLGLNIDNMGQWLMLKNKISNASFIENSQTKLLSTNSVIFQISLKDSNINIDSYFKNIGINIRKRSINHYFGSIITNNENDI